MRKVPIRRPSPALVVACFALGVALTGTSYATVLNVPDGSVTTAKIKNGAVTTPKLKNDAVTVRQAFAANSVRAGQVKNGSLLKEDFKSGQLPAGPPGPQGPQGPQGPAGPNGRPGISGLQRVDAQTSASSANSKSAVVTCAGGKRVVGGGARVTGDGAAKVSITESFPDSGGNKWNGRAGTRLSRRAGSWRGFQIYALCANVAGVEVSDAALVRNAHRLLSRRTRNRRSCWGLPPPLNACRWVGGRFQAPGRWRGGSPTRLMANAAGTVAVGKTHEWTPARDARPGSYPSGTMEQQGPLGARLKPVD